MLNDENRPVPTEKYDQWLQAEFNKWLSDTMDMSHDKIIRDACQIYVDLHERNAAAYASDEYKAWAVESNFYEIESLQIDEDFCVHPSGIGETLKKAAAEREQRGFYIPIDSYKPRELRDSLKRKVADEYDGALTMFRCMDKKNLILHAYELSQLEWFRDELDGQLSDLPLDRRELINLHYRRNLLETVFADDMETTLDQLFSHTECVPGLTDHFPAIRPDCPSHPVEAFRQKVDDCYGKHIAGWLKMTPDEFRNQAHWVACVMDTHRRLMNDQYGNQRLSAMIRLNDPLTAVSRKWWAAKKWDPVQDYSQFIDSIGLLETELDQNPQRYELDGRYHTPEPEAPVQDHGPEEEHHPLGPAQGVTMC